MNKKLKIYSTLFVAVLIILVVTNVFYFHESIVRHFQTVVSSPPIMRHTAMKSMWRQKTSSSKSRLCQRRKCQTVMG